MTAVSEVDDVTRTLVAANFPTLTLALPKNEVPEIVIAVPPALVPELTETPEVVGAAASGVTLTADDAEDSPTEFRAFK